MSSDDIGADLRAYAVVCAYKNREACDGILKDRKAFLHMVFTVHTKLCSTSASSYNNVLEGSCLNKSSSMQHSMSRSGTEATNVRTSCVGVACDLSSSLGEVSAAALVHIAACFLTAVDHIINLIRVYAGFLYQFDQGKNVGSLCNQVFEHNMGRQVYVYVMSALYSTNQLMLKV